jgi:hypothetical protein
MLLWLGRSPDRRGDDHLRVFSRHDQQMTIQIGSLAGRYTVSVRQPDRPEEHTHGVQAADVMLRQTILEHELIANVGSLEFRRAIDDPVPPDSVDSVAPVSIRIRGFRVVRLTTSVTRYARYDAMPPGGVA